MRLFTISFIFLFCFISCKSNKSALEKEVFIIPTRNYVDTSKNFVQFNSKDAVYFSKEFWQYFIHKRPVTTGNVFLLPFIDSTAMTYRLLKDTSLLVFVPSPMYAWMMKDELPEDAGAKEKNHLSFFILPKDTTNMAAKEKKHEQLLNAYPITEKVKTEYAAFRKLLTDTSDYSIIYKKSFALDILKLYKTEY